MPENDSEFPIPKALILENSRSSMIKSIFTATGRESADREEAEDAGEPVKLFSEIRFIFEENLLYELTC